MWQALIPIIANLAAKNNPNAGKINTAMQAMDLIKGFKKEK